MKSNDIIHTPSTTTGPDAVVRNQPVLVGGVNLINMETTNFDEMRVHVNEYSDAYKASYAKQSLLNILDMFDSMPPQQTKSWLQTVLNKL